jgi:hypothetical protein
LNHGGYADVEDDEDDGVAVAVLLVPVALMAAKASRSDLALPHGQIRRRRPDYQA